VLKRLSLLNKHYPLESPVDCQQVDFQRQMESNLENSEKIYIATRDAFIDQGLVFFGGYASSLYSKYMPEEFQKKVQSIPDFDVLSENPLSSANVVLEKLKTIGIKGVRLIHRKPIGEIIPACIEIKVGVDSIAFIYEPIACHNYNVMTMNGKEVRVATIDTMLSFYLAFYYADAKYYYKERILCMAKFLFDVQQANRLEQRGVLKRFSIDCYGKQSTLETMRSEKSEMFRVLKKGTREYDRWFLKYNPVEVLQKTRPSSSVKKEKGIGKEQIKEIKSRKNRRNKRSSSWTGLFKNKKNKTNKKIRKSSEYLNEY
jgi:hypothetical protein